MQSKRYAVFLFQGCVHLYVCIFIIIIIIVIIICILIRFLLVMVDLFSCFVWFLYPAQLYNNFQCIINLQKLPK